MIDKIIDIEIYGQHYRIRVKGEEDEKYIGHLTSYVDQKMHEVAVKSKSADTTKIAVLAALNIADELFLSQKKLDQLNEAIGHMETEIESLEVHLSQDENTYKSLGKAFLVRTLIRTGIDVADRAAAGTPRLVRAPGSAAGALPSRERPRHVTRFPVPPCISSPLIITRR